MTLDDTFTARQAEILDRDYYSEFVTALDHAKATNPLRDSPKPSTEYEDRVRAQLEDCESDEAEAQRWVERFAADPFPDVTYAPAVGTRGRRVLNWGES